MVKYDYDDLLATLRHDLEAEQAKLKYRLREVQEAISEGYSTQARQASADLIKHQALIEYIKGLLEKVV